MWGGFSNPPDGFSNPPDGFSNPPAGQRTRLTSAQRGFFFMIFA